MEDPQTPEQQKEIAKIHARSRLNQVFIGLKFGAGLLLANLITMGIGIKFLVNPDTDPDAIGAFNFLCMLINTVFMCSYLGGQMKKDSDIVKSKIKDVLKK